MKTQLALRDRVRASLLAAGLGFGVTGCSSLTQDMNAHGEGWRTVSLVQIGTAGQIERRALTDCRTTTPPDRTGDRYAVVEYRSGGRLHIHILKMDEMSQARVGDTVYTNVLTCGAPFTAPPPRRLF